MIHLPDWVFVLTLTASSLAAASAAGLVVHLILRQHDREVGFDRAERELDQSVEAFSAERWALIDIGESAREARIAREAMYALVDGKGGDQAWDAAVRRREAAEACLDRAVRYWEEEVRPPRSSVPASDPFLCRSETFAAAAAPAEPAEEER